MKKLGLKLMIAVSAAVAFAGPAFGQSKGGGDAEPSGDWMQRVESAIFDTPSTGKNGDGVPGSGDADASANTADTPSAPQADDDQDFKNGRADLTGETGDDAPIPGSDAGDAPDKYIPDAGDPND